ncbi:hypothetical protein, partial [Staphylococcus aureus]|uniref:hypothetical protein n=1 Tax=Staphylococcus aureus TaxID=1280 RepID=UPI001C1F8CFB
NKTQNNRYLPFLKDWTKGTIFATVTAIGVGFIASLFLVSFIAAAIAVITFVGLSAFTFYKALKDNKATMEFGKSEFREVESNNTLSDAQTRTVPALDKQNPMPTWQQNPEDKKSEAMASKFGSFFEPVKEACKTIPKEILKIISPSRTIANRG